jgi:hypothetical protein
LIIISEARINIKIKEIPKITIIEIIPKVLREVHAEAAEISFREEVIPKTLSNITLRDTRSVIN